MFTNSTMSFDVDKNSSDDLHKGKSMTNNRPIGLANGAEQGTGTYPFLYKKSITIGSIVRSLQCIPMFLFIE